MPTWGVGHGFGNAGLWEVTIARAVVGGSFERRRTVFWPIYLFFAENTEELAPGR